MEEAREPFRSALRRGLDGETVIRLLVSTPPFATFQRRTPASVFAVGRTGWLCVQETDRDDTVTIRSDFAHTLLVELTVILLYGRLRIVFAAEGRAQSLAIEFNSVGEPCYQEIARLLLDRMQGVAPTVPGIPQLNPPSVDTFPLKFRHALQESMPSGERLLAVAKWPAAVVAYNRWFQRELAPEAMLALSERELLLISDEKTKSSLRIGRVGKYGTVVTHCPLSWLENYRCEEAGSLTQLKLAVRIGSVEEIVQVALPVEHTSAVQEIVRQAFRQKEIGHTSVG